MTPLNDPEVAEWRRTLHRWERRRAIAARASKKSRRRRQGFGDRRQAILARIDRWISYADAHYQAAFNRSMSDCLGSGIVNFTDPDFDPAAPLPEPPTKKRIRAEQREEDRSKVQELEKCLEHGPSPTLEQLLALIKSRMLQS